MFITMEKLGVYDQLHYRLLLHYNTCPETKNMLASPLKVMQESILLSLFIFRVHANHNE